MVKEVFSKTIIILSLLLTLTLVSAPAIDNPNIPIIKPDVINFDPNITVNVSVNSSLFWDTLDRGALRSVSDIRHAWLSGLQGGTSGEYYHLNGDEHSFFTSNINNFILETNLSTALNNFFDQDLNTTNNVTFNTMNLSCIGSPGNETGACLNVSGDIRVRDIYARDGYFANTTIYIGDQIRLSAEGTTGAVLNISGGNVSVGSTGYYFGSGQYLTDLNLTDISFEGDTINATQFNGNFSGGTFSGDYFEVNGSRWKGLSPNHLIDGSVLGLMMTNPPNPELPHLYIQTGGSNQFSGMIRTWGVVNENVSFLNNSNRTDCISYFESISEELKIDCNTTTTGADFFVSDDFQVVGDVWIKDTDNEWHFMTRELELLDHLREDTLITGVLPTLVGNNLTITELSGASLIVNLNATNTDLGKTVDTILLTEGTNSTPVFNAVYYTNQTNPVLTVSTQTQTNVADIAQSYLGSGIDFASLAGSATQEKFTKGVYERFFDEGALYTSGFDISVSTTEINITNGTMRILLEDATTTKDYSTSEEYIRVSSSGSFSIEGSNGLDDLDTYNTGEGIGNNRYFSAVCGIVYTINQEGKMYCVVQDKPPTQFSNALEAEIDSTYVNFFPPNSFVQKIYVPVVRVIVKKTGSTFTLQQFSNGDYLQDLRGVKTLSSSTGTEFVAGLEQVLINNNTGSTNMVLHNNLTVEGNLLLDSIISTTDIDFVANVINVSQSLLWGTNASFENYLSHTTVNNNTNALEDFLEGQNYYDNNGSINHSSFGDCYVPYVVPDYTRPLQTNNTVEICHPKWGVCENVTQTTTTYPYTTTVDMVDSSCMDAKQTQALARINSVVDIIENDTVDITTDLMVENLYTQSKTVDNVTDYFDKFKNKTTLSDKETHPAKDYKVDIKGNNITVLNMEERIVFLEGAVNALMLELCNKNKNAYEWCDG